MTGRSRSRSALFAALVALAGCASSARASQLGADGHDALRLLRAATTAEASGDLEGAAEIVKRVLEAHPGSLNALLVLERLFGMLGRTEELLPHVDVLLEREPASIVGHQMRVRALAVLGRTDAMARAARAWISAMPAVETPYREAARAWRRQAEYGRAVAVLEEGRWRIDRPDALALELGDAWADAHRFDRVAAEWARAIGPDGQAFLLVQRRVGTLRGPGSARVIPELVELLSAPPATTARTKAALQLAVDAGLETTASRLATHLDRTLDGDRRDAFLIELARRSDGAGLQHLAYWAYARLVEEGVARRDAGMSLALRTRLAELAFATGDPVAADAAFRAIEQSLEPGSPTMRQALSLRVMFLAREGNIAAARTEVDRLRADFAAAPETDAAIGHVAHALLERDMLSGAVEVLDGAAGPRASLVRARVRIQQGEYERAERELLRAAPLLHGAEATEAIALAQLLGRLSREGAALVMRSMAAGTEQRNALRGLLEGVDVLDADEQVALLEYAADIADRNGMAIDAEHIRREIIEEFPGSPEAPTALLALARGMLDRGAPPDDVRSLLERMILDYPRSALLPQARRELQRLAARNELMEALDP